MGGAGGSRREGRRATRLSILCHIDMRLRESNSGWRPPRRRVSDSMQPEAWAGPLQWSWAEVVWSLCKLWCGRVWQGRRPRPKWMKARVADSHPHLPGAAAVGVAPAPVPVGSGGCPASRLPHAHGTATDQRKWQKYPKRTGNPTEIHFRVSAIRTRTLPQPRQDGRRWERGPWAGRALEGGRGTRRQVREQQPASRSPHQPGEWPWPAGAAEGSCQLQTLTAGTDECTKGEVHSHFGQR